MRLNTLGGRNSSFDSLGSQPARWQWQPTLTAHDPDPPLPLEDVQPAPGVTRVRNINAG